MNGCKEMGAFVSIASCIRICTIWRKRWWICMILDETSRSMH